MKARNAVLAIVLGVAACSGAGMLAWRALPPSRSGEVVTVIVRSEGTPPSNEQQIAMPIESALAQLQGVKRVRSESHAGFAVATCFFDPALDGLTAAAEVRDAIQPLLPRLPAGASPPMVMRASSDEPALWAIGDAHVRELLEVVSGVASVEACGETEERIRVTVDPARLVASRVTLDGLIHALPAPSALIFPTGRERSIGLSGGRALPDPGELSRAPLTTTTPPVRLADVARIAVHRRSTGCEASPIAEREILARITLQHGASRNEVAKALEAKVRSSGVRWLDPKRTVVLGVGVPREASERLATTIAGQLAAVPGVARVLAARHDDRDDDVELVVDMDPAAVKQGMPELRRVASSTQPGVAWRGFRSSPIGTPPVLTVTLSGPELDSLDARAQDVEKKLEHVEGMGPLLTRGPRSTPELDIQIDRDAAGRYQLPVSAVAQTIQAASGGIDLGNITVVLGDAEDGAAAERLLRLPMGSVPLGLVAKITMRVQPRSILRIDRERAVELRWETEPSLSKSAVERALTGTSARIDLGR